MQRLFILLCLATLHSTVFAQHVYKIKTDSLLVTNDSCNAELILENESKYVKGFLYNKGKGRTIFQQAMIKLNDSMYVFGNDTLNFRNLLNTIGFSGSNIYNTDGTLTANRLISSSGFTLGFDGKMNIGNGSINTNSDVFVTMPNAKAIRGSGATNGQFYIDASQDLTGTLSFRSTTSSFSGNVTMPSVNAGSLTVSSLNTVGIITGTGVTSFRIGNTTSSSTWFFENHRNAPSGSLEISNSLSVPAITLFPNRNISIGSNSDNGYKLDVSGHTSIRGEITMNLVNSGFIRYAGEFLAFPRQGGAAPWRLHNSTIGDGFSLETQNIGQYFRVSESGAGNTNGDIRYMEYSGQGHGRHTLSIYYTGIGATTRVNFKQRGQATGYGHGLDIMIAGGDSGDWSNVDNRGVSGTATLAGGDAYTGTTDVAGGNVFVQGGRGTGAGTPGDFVISTSTTLSSGTSLQTLSNRWWVKGGSGYLGNSSTPTSTIDLTGTTGHSQFRLRTSYTPTSTSDTNGNTGDFSWDDNYFYIKTSTGWKRSALSTF